MLQSHLRKYCCVHSDGVEWIECFWQTNLQQNDLSHIGLSKCCMMLEIFKQLGVSFIFVYKTLQKVKTSGSCKSRNESRNDVLFETPSSAPKMNRILTFEYMTNNESTVKMLLRTARQYLHPESPTWKEVCYPFGTNRCP